jgi:hypothetical protein
VTAIGVDPALPDDDLADAWKQFSPRVAFVAGGESLRRVLELRQALGRPEVVVSLDAGPPPEGALSFAEQLDLGGTLDTAERAGDFRALVRGVASKTCAIAHVGRSAGGTAPTGS